MHVLARCHTQAGWMRSIPAKALSAYAPRVSGEGSRRCQRQKKLFTAPDPSRSQIFCSAFGVHSRRKRLFSAV